MKKIGELEMKSKRKIILAVGTILLVFGIAAAFFLRWFFTDKQYKVAEDIGDSNIESVVDEEEVEEKKNENQVPDTDNIWEVPDFIVEVEEGKDPMILQLTDTQIIDASQQRTASRLSAGSKDYWSHDKMKVRLFDCITETIQATKPDLILITGDLVYGEFDDTGSSWKALIKFIESFQIPWAPVMGNHDQESKQGADWQCEQLEQAEYCLFKQRTLTGNGNYTVGIKQGDELKRVFFMLDSNGCGNASEESMRNGHTQKTVGFGGDQIIWYSGMANKIKKLSPDTKLSFVFHIQIAAFWNAMTQYGTINDDTQVNPISIDKHANKAEGDFGYIGRNLKSEWDLDYGIWKSFKSIGVDSIFVGHEHANSASVVYEGIRCQYGQKTGTYERTNYYMGDGKVECKISQGGTPVEGGSVMVLSQADGSIQDAYIYLCHGLQPI